MPGSQTTQGRGGACDSALHRIAFRINDNVGTLNNHLSRLNGWPIRTSVNASRRTSRYATHDSRTV